MTTPRARAARLLAMRATADTLMVLLRAGEDEIPVAVELAPPTAAALAHVYALHGHRTACGRAPDVHVGVLQRATTALGAAAPRLVVRAGARPAFWLRLVAGEERTEIGLDVLDAAVLLLSRRVPVDLVETDEFGWDRALTHLMEHER